MATFDPERDGCDLRTAIMRFSIPSMLAATARDIIDLRANDIPFQMPVWWLHSLAPEPAEPDRRPDAAKRLQIGAAIGPGFGPEKSFWMKLRKGELTCWARPAEIDPRVRIPPDAWSTLTIVNWGSGRIRRSDGSYLYGAVIELTASSVDRHRTGGQGRPTSRHLIMAEFERRSAAGEVEPKISDEAAALCAWLKQASPEAPPLVQASTENIIRDRYRAHKSHENNRSK